MSPLVVDARGLSCPQPVIDLARAAVGAEPGTAVEVLATDPAARYDVPAWCRLRGHHLDDVRQVGDDPPTWSIRLHLSA